MYILHSYVMLILKNNLPVPHKKCKITTKGGGAVQRSEYTHMHLRVRVWQSVLTIRYPWVKGRGG